MARLKWIGLINFSLVIEMNQFLTVGGVFISWSKIDPTFKSFEMSVQFSK